MSPFSRKKLLQKKIGVLLGGLSAEREISLRTGKATLDALQQLGYQAVAIDVGTNLPAQLQDAGVDMTSPEPIETTIKFFSNLVDKLENLLQH